MANDVRRNFLFIAERKKGQGRRIRMSEVHLCTIYIALKFSPKLFFPKRAKIITDRSLRDRQIRWNQILLKCGQVKNALVRNDRIVEINSNRNSHIKNSDQ